MKTDNEFSSGYKTDIAKHFINYKHILSTASTVCVSDMAALSRKHSGMGQVH
jgi:hypothetical protein